jgi:Tfp pilus assembly protein PilF
MMAEISELRKRVEQSPEDLASLTRLANLYHDVQMWEPAKTFYARALELAPDDPNLITDYGVCFVGTGDFARAIELFGRAQEADPTHPQSLFNTAVVRGVHMGDIPGALATLDRLESVAPDFPRTADLRAQLEAAGS